MNRPVTARIQTLFVVACLVVGTVGIALAFGCEKGNVRIRDGIMGFLGVLILTSEALVLWVTSPSLWTIAQRTVVGDATLGISSARVALGTRILTTLVDTGLVARALRIATAFHGRDWFLVAVDEWIADHVVGATTDGAMVLGHTLGIPGTWITNGARILAYAVTTDFGGEAVLVGLASLVTSCKYRKISFITVILGVDQNDVGKGAKK